MVKVDGCIITPKSRQHTGQMAPEPRAIVPYLSSPFPNAAGLDRPRPVQEQCRFNESIPHPRHCLRRGRGSARPALGVSAATPSSRARARASQPGGIPCGFAAPPPTTEGGSGRSLDPYVTNVGLQQAFPIRATVPGSGRTPCGAQVGSCPSAVGLPFSPNGAGDRLASPRSLSDDTLISDSGVEVP